MRSLAVTTSTLAWPTSPLRPIDQPAIFQAVKSSGMVQTTSASPFWSVITFAPQNAVSANFDRIAGATSFGRPGTRDGTISPILPPIPPIPPPPNSSNAAILEGLMEFGRR